MEAIAIAGGGEFVNSSNLQDLIDVFTGSGGNLANISQVDVTLPDGTFLSNIGLTSGLGDFKVPTGYALMAGANTWLVDVLFDDNSSAQASLTIVGTTTGGGGGTSPVPLPAAAWMMLAGLGALGAVRSRRRS